MMERWACPFCSEPLEAEETSSSENLDGTSGPLLRGRFRCARSGLVLVQELILHYPDAIGHWYLGSGFDDRICLRLRPGSTPKEQRWITCSYCRGGGARPICLHPERGASSWVVMTAEQRTETRDIDGHSVTVEVDVFRCPTCGKTSEHRVIRREPTRL